MIKKNLIVYIFITILIFPNIVFAQNTIDTTYNYNWWGNAIENIPFFELYDTIDVDNMDGIKISGMDDVNVKNGRIYIVDSTESRINIFNSKDFKLITSLKNIRNREGKIATDEKTGQQILLKNPEGIFVHSQNEEIYIADTGNERIVVIDEKDFSFKRTITKPSNMVGQTNFKPSKIVVDKLNRIYVVVQSGFEGIIELTSDGDFKRYFGVNKPKVNLVDYFWRQYASEEQKAKMTKILAPSFNNIDIDSEGFIYATTFDASATDKVFRLNPKGENILREEGYFPVIGDLDLEDIKNSIKSPESQFVDIALTDYGTYALLDKNNGRIFIYNFDGELLNIFGQKGFMKGEFSEPTSIAWLDDNLIITDKQMKCAYIFKPTTIGKLMLQSSEAYYNGEWDKSTELLKEAVKLNSNLEIAYNSIGKSYLMEDDYETAMYYFNLSKNKIYYSKAFNGYRSIWIQDNFNWIFILMILGVAGVIYSEIRYYKKKKKIGGEDDE